MSHSAVVHARIDPATKAITEKALAALGMSPTEAIRLFYRQIAPRQEFPIGLLLTGKPLPPRHKDYPLGGNWKGHRDCHIEPAWLLLYRISSQELRLERTGTHSDLF